MPIFDRNQAKESGFAQVRGALEKFKGDVVNVRVDEYPPSRGDDGRPMPGAEYMEIELVNVEVLEVNEELSMPIEEWNFRITCSPYNGSFWVDYFLASADKFKIQLPEGLKGKRVTFHRVQWEFTRKNGEVVRNSNFVIAGIEGSTTSATPAPKVVSKTSEPTGTEEAPAAEEAGEPTPVDPMAIARDTAIGKTEAQFKTAIATNPIFANSPLLSMAKSGMITKALVDEGKLVLVKQGKSEVYQLPS